jgi:3-phenylpropionate/trans-cinnamate dioxygenase ferredoxin reductase subunit
MIPSTIAIVGAGQAAAVATRSLRRRGFDGRIVLIGDEPERPYQRPPLSKEYLTGAADAALYLLPESWTETNQVDVRTGVRALKISAADRSVLLDDGSSVPADQVLITTGGRARRMPDAEGDRILYLRTKADADRLRAHLGAGTRLVVIGAGFVGAEVASTARGLGATVTVLEAGPAPMSRILGPELGAACGRLHTQAGVELRLNSEVRRVEQVGDVVRVTTGTGTIEADLVVVGIGMEPNDEVARDSGIDTGNGILVDEYCRTSLEFVYAAGDVANHHHPLYGTRLRVEHFDNASKQAAVAANNMLGRTSAYADPHWCWSDQFGVNLQYVGHADPQDQLVVRGETHGSRWSAFFVRDGRLRAAFAVDSPEDVMVARELISAQAPVEIALLRDPNADLMDLMEEM